MPAATAALDYRDEFSPEEFEKIQRGLIPQVMEDKWFIYFDGSTLYLHRSWTGHCIYEVEFEEEAGRHVVRRARVNRDQAEYTCTSANEDVATLRYLIDNFLLGRGTANRKPWWKFW